MATELQQHEMYESETGDATTPSQTHKHNHDRNLAWWKSNPQPCCPSASSSVYSTSSEKGLAPEQVLSSPTTSVCVAASNGPFLDLEEPTVTQTTGSVTSVTSACNSNMQTLGHHPEQGQQQSRHKQETNSERWSQYSSGSAASSLKKRFKPRNPFKWLHRHSESCSSTQCQLREQDITHSIIEPKQTNLSDEIIRDFGTDLVEKMDMLERKVHALSCSPVFTPQPRREEKGVSVGVQADLHNRKQQENHNDEDKSYHNKLEEEVTHLTNTNTNLSSLNALLSSDLYRSQNDIQNLQDEICLLHEEKFSLERWHGSYDEQRVQIELQTDLIRRLGVLLGRREEQLDSERRMMKLYRDRINRLEDEVEMLRTEWERVLPLVIPRDKGPVLTSTVEIDKDK